MDKRKWFSVLAAWVMLANIALIVGQATPAPAYAQGQRTFPETGKTVKGRFLEYWNQNGGLPQQGYPISEEMQEVNDDDGKTYTVQYFERAVFEKHPEKARPYDVLLSLLGVFYYNEKYGGNAPGQQASTTNPRKFTETGKTIGGVFRKYWEGHGGLPQQGYPISDEFQEVDKDGVTRTVQYFQRAVFEYHEEYAGTSSEVLLSLLGVFYYQKKYGGGPAPTPTTKPNTTPKPQALTLKNLATSFCLDSNPSYQVYTHVCNGGAYQKWGVQNNNDSTISFADLATSFCLETNTNNEVHTWSCNGGPYQKWQIQDNGDGSITFQNPETSFCLDSNPSAVYTHVCNGGSYQRWR
jgi:Ricin-type beta-trefoil lectin domain-like